MQPCYNGLETQSVEKVLLAWNSMLQPTRITHWEIASDDESKEHEPNQQKKRSLCEADPG